MQGSRRYTDSERFPISRDDWPRARPSVLHDLELSPSAEHRFARLLERTATHRDVLDRDLQGGDADVTVGEHGKAAARRAA